MDAIQHRSDLGCISPEGNSLNLISNPLFSHPEFQFKFDVDLDKPWNNIGTSMDDVSQTEYPIRTSAVGESSFSNNRKKFTGSLYGRGHTMVDEGGRTGRRELEVRNQSLRIAAKIGGAPEANERCE
jgi:hypothetical protein